MTVGDQAHGQGLGSRAIAAPRESAVTRCKKEGVLHGVNCQQTAACGRRPNRRLQPDRRTCGLPPQATQIGPIHTIAGALADFMAECMMG